MLRPICNPEQPEILNHLTSVGLCKSEDEDTITMRQLFVEEIMKFEDELLAFFPNQDREAFVKRVLEFRRQGMFDTAIGDLFFFFFFLGIYYSTVILIRSTCDKSMKVKESVCLREPFANICLPLFPPAENVSTGFIGCILL